MISSSVVVQVGLYHDQQTEDGGSSKENRNIYSESMPRRVGSFYRGLFSHSDTSGCVEITFSDLRIRHFIYYKSYIVIFRPFV